MLRVLLVIVLAPPAAILTWLSLGSHSQRADFVLTSSEPRTLDPHRVSWLPEIQLAAAMFEGLTRLNPETFQPEPAVASHWEVSENGTVFTFHLRPEARWSTGEPVVAEDFRFAWLRVLDPRCEAQYAGLFFVIRGAESYYRTRLDDDPANDLPGEEVGIEPVNAGTLRVTLAGPCSYFLDLTSFVTFSPAHRPTLARWAYWDGQVLRATQHLWTRPEHIVCNGAFVLTRWDFKQRIWLERNPHYWDAAALGVNWIEAWITSDPNAALIAYRTGRVDLVRGLERSVAEALQAEQAAGRRHDYHTGDRFATFFYRVNCRRWPLDNPDLRKALSLAIDREAICRHVLRLGETPAYTYLPRAAVHLMPRTDTGGQAIYYWPPAGLGAGLGRQQREDLARAYLHKSGFDRHIGDRPIEIAFPASDPEQRLVAETVQAMWERVLGIRVELRTIEGKVLSTRIRDLDYDLARSDWFGDYLDPSTFLDMFTSAGGQNRTGWSNAEYDRFISAAAAEADDARRFELFGAAERILCEEQLPIIPVFFRRGSYLLNPRFGGLHDNVRDLLLIHRVRLSE
jgi:oligopeptide transport system substrate-binding protein